MRQREWVADWARSDKGDWQGTQVKWGHRGDAGLVSTVRVRPAGPSVGITSTEAQGKGPGAQLGVLCRQQSRKTKETGLADEPRGGRDVEESSAWWGLYG